MAGPTNSSFDEPRNGSAMDNMAEMEAPSTSTRGGPPMNMEAVNNVMNSDIGINVLLNRLKQSIASARDFSSFLSKRARLEDEHAQGLKKLSRATLEGVRRQDGRQFTYAQNFASVCMAHDRMADHGVQFANSLHQMHQDVDELTARIERERKHWKSEGMNSEKRVKDAESALEKAKVRYDSLAEDYDRARTGGASSGRVFTVKGPKSAEKHEEDLSRKVQNADADYASKVQSAQSTRQENINDWRPKAVRTIQELIRECDSALTLQLQKFAAFNEKLIVGNGLEVSPVKPDADPSRPSSMREMVHQIDNDRDFHNYIASHSGNVPPPAPEIVYRKHQALGGGPSQAPPLQTITPDKRQSGAFRQSPITQSPSTFTSNQPPVSSYPSTTQQPSTITSVPPQMSTQPQSSFDNYNGSPAAPVGPQSYSQGRQTQPVADRSYHGPSQQQSQYGSAPTQGINSGAYREPPRQATASPFSNATPSTASPLSANGTNGVGNYGAPPPQPAQQQQSLPATKPVFGQSLETLFRRDEIAVPYVVMQCITAVELFGLEHEGIYRQNGNASHIQQLKTVFDRDTTPPDFRNPSAFHHDVNSVAGLLKTFFRELPEPLFTTEQYPAFIAAAKEDNDDARRDQIHGIINALPDPNYATLRVLVLHLSRVAERSEMNRMSEHNLAICFAPTLMGQHTGSQMADAGFQATVLNTILKHTYSIFDEDY